MENNRKLALIGDEYRTNPGKPVQACIFFNSLRYPIMNPTRKSSFPFIKRAQLLVLLFAFAGCAPKKTLIEFREGDKFGFKTIYGEVIIPAQYESTSGFYNGFNCVKKDGKWGALNEEGKMVIVPTYDELLEFSTEGISPAKQNGKYGFVDIHGKEITPFIYEQTWFFEDGLCCVKKDEKWGFINTSGQVVIPFEYDDFSVPRFCEGLIAVAKDNKWGFIDKNNKVVIPFDYTQVEGFSEGIAAVEKSYSKWGYIDHNNKEVLPFIYENPGGCDDDGGKFKNGIAAANLSGKMGYMNRKGEAVIPFKYYCIHSFYKGYAAVKIDNGVSWFSNDHAILQTGYLDSAGREYLQDYKDYTWYDWQVNKAPAALPDFSNVLTGYPNKPEPRDHAGVVMYPDAIYVKGSAVSYETDSLLVGSADSLGIISYSSIAARPLSAADSVNKYIVDKKQKEEAEKEKTRQENAKWSLEKTLNLALCAFTQEPKTYPNLDRLTEISIAYGLMLDGGNFGEYLIGNNRWLDFRKETIYKIISDESLRQAAWKWVAPYYKQSFMTLHPFHKTIYKDIATHLKNYINTYDVKKVNAYLKRDERKFAQYDSDGKYDPYRKLYSFVDRLILVHKVITVADAKTWINKVADEVLSW